MKATHETRWGSDAVRITANWSEASDIVEGVGGSMQVGSFSCNPKRAMHMALFQLAQCEGPVTDKVQEAIADAVAAMKRVDSE
jgi:hypothetical protein